MFVKQIIGWVLLAAGLAVIGYVLYSSYNIFTAKTEPPAVFQITQKEEAAAPQAPSQITGLGDISAQMEQMLGEQLKGILPVDLLPKMMNLGAWSIFSGILIFAGSKISGLGIRLMKKT